MTILTPTSSTPLPAPIPSKHDRQLVRNEARLTAIVEAAYILEAIRR
jgi:hypothetical protein